MNVLLMGKNVQQLILKVFFKTIDPEKVYDAYEEYLKLIGLEVIEI